MGSGGAVGCGAASIVSLNLPPGSCASGYKASASPPLQQLPREVEKTCGLGDVAWDKFGCPCRLGLENLLPLTFDSPVTFTQQPS